MYLTIRAFPGGSDGKDSTCSAGEMGSIPESPRSPGAEKGLLREPSKEYLLKMPQLPDGF